MNPVPLTLEQINTVLREIPNPPGIGKNAISIARKHTVNRIRTILQDIKLVPVKAAFEEFKNEIISNIYESYIEQGRPVGVTSGVALGGPITQLSLNTFHFAGSQSGVALTFKKVNDLLTGSRMNRTPQMKIYFRKPGTGTDIHDVIHEGTFDSIMKLRPEFEQTTVKDLVLDTEILTTEEALEIGVINMLNLHASLLPQKFADANDRFKLTYVLEIELNTYRMYSHKITMKQVASAIEGPNPSDIVACVWESQFAEKMYVLIDENADLGQQTMNQTTAIPIFFQQRIIKQFPLWKISGITKVISIYPKVINIIQGIHHTETSKDIHKVYTTNMITRWQGISLGDISNLFSSAGFVVDKLEDDNKENLYVTVKYDGDLMKELVNRIENSEGKDAGERTEQDNNLLKAATYYYVETSGNNMNEIIWRDDIDQYRTMSNDTHEIQDTMGIDAARLYLIFKFSQTLLDFSSYINNRHISLIFDLFTNLGIINSLSFAGINRTKIGPLALASFERALDVFSNASIFGERESTVGVSSSIYLGQKSRRVGTGAIQIEEDLSIIPKEKHAPNINDMDVTDKELDEDLMEGTDYTSLFLKGDSESEPMSSRLSGKIDKSEFKSKTTIGDIDQQPPLDDNSLIPSSRKMAVASEALAKALQKVTVGTGISVSPVESEIVDVPVVSPLTQQGGQRLIPGSPTPDSNIMSTLTNVSQQTQLPKSVVELKPAPKSPTINLTPSVAVQPIEVGSELRKPTSSSQMQGVILNENVPKLEPVPIVGTPNVPTKSPEIIIDTGENFITSFLQTLPSSTGTQQTKLVRHSVGPIPVQNVMTTLTTLPITKVQLKQ